MLLVACQLSRDVLGYEDSFVMFCLRTLVMFAPMFVTLVRFDLSIVTIKQSFIVNQIVSFPVVLS